MLIANYSLLLSNNVGHYKMGGGITNPYSIIKPSTLRNKWLSPDCNNEQWKRDSISTGHTPPYVLVLGSKGFLLKSTTLSNGVANVSGNISKGINIVGDSNGIASTTSSLSVLSALAGIIAGSSSAVGALSGIVQLLGNVSGTGNGSGALS